MQMHTSRFRVDGGSKFSWTVLGAAILASLLVASPGRLCAQAAPLSIQGRNLIAGGRPVYLFGQGFWHAAVKGGFDVAQEAKWYGPYGANFTRIKTVTTRILPTNKTYTPENPWVRLTSGKYDLTKFNATFWQRLDTTLKENEKAGRYVILQIFDEVTMKAGSDQWDSHPLCSSNNINAIGTPAAGGGRKGFPDVYDLQNTKLKDIHQNYLGKLLESTYQYKHVIYEVGNEYSGTKEFLRWVLDLIITFEQKKQVNLLVSNMSVTQRLFDEEEEHKGIDLLDFWHAPRSIRTLQIHEIYAYVTSLRTNYTKPLFTGRIGPEPDKTNATPSWRRVARAQMWTVLMAGAVGATTKEDYDGIENGAPAYDIDDKWETQGFLGLHCVLDNLAHRAALIPKNDLIASKPFVNTWAATVGPEILVYMVDIKNGGGGTLQLNNVPDGRYTAKVYAPDPGQVLRVDRIQVTNGRASIPVDTISIGDRVVWLTPEPMDITARWEEQNGLRRCVIEVRDLQPLGGHKFYLNGHDVSSVLPYLLTASSLPGGGIKLATPWLTFPKGVYELEAAVWGPTIGVERSIMRMQVK